MTKKSLGLLLTLLLSNSVLAANTIECKSTYEAKYQNAFALEAGDIAEIDSNFDVNLPINVVLTSSHCKPQTKGIDEVPDIAREGDSRTITQKRGNVITTYEQTFRNGRWITTKVTMQLLESQ